MTYELVSPHNNEIVAVATRNNNDVHLLTQDAGIGKNGRCKTIAKRTQYGDLDRPRPEQLCQPLTRETNPIMRGLTRGKGSRAFAETGLVHEARVVRETKPVGGAPAALTRPKQFGRVLRR